MADDVPRPPIDRVLCEGTLIGLTPSDTHRRSKNPREDQKYDQHSRNDGGKKPTPRPFPEGDEVRHGLPLLEPLPPEHRVHIDQPRIQQVVDLWNGIRPFLFSTDMQVKNLGIQWGIGFSSG